MKPVWGTGKKKERKGCIWKFGQRWRLQKKSPTHFSFASGSGEISQLDFFLILLLSAPFQGRNNEVEMPIFFFSEIPATSFLAPLLPTFDYLEITYEKQFQGPYSTRLIFPSIPFNGFCTSWVSDYVIVGKLHDVTLAIDRHRFEYKILNS